MQSTSPHLKSTRYKYGMLVFELGWAQSRAQCGNFPEYFG